MRGSMAVVLAAAVALGACSAPKDLEGVYRGNGANRLVLRDGRWRLDSGLVEWVGSYRADGHRVWLETRRVIPERGHGTDCYDDVEPYAWSVEDGSLSLRLQVVESCSRNRNSVLQTAQWRRVP